jgi:hypothetical protein
MQEPTQVKHFSGPPLYGRLLAYPQKLEKACHGQTPQVITKIRKLQTKSCITSGPGANVKKLW